MEIRVKVVESGSVRVCLGSAGVGCHVNGCGVTVSGAADASGGVGGKLIDVGRG